MGGKPVHREELDDFDAHGLQMAMCWQYGAGTREESDVMRGWDGGVADAKAAQEQLDKIRASGHPVFFCVDFDISLTDWNNVAVEYFRGAASVLGKQRIGIYGKSTVLAWAMEDDVVATVEPGVILGWQTKSWSHGVKANYAVLYQSQHNVGGPDGVQIDVNDVLHPEFGWRALDAYQKPAAAVDTADLPRVDKHVWLNKHYTQGRNRKVKHITRHHLAGIGTTEDVWGWWQTRAASAHFVVEQDGTVGQLVREGDVAWSNANSVSNNESITIEHANSGGAAADWPISSTTINRGAELAAELCLKHNLGRPEFGVNIRDHREWAATSCPHHLAHGNKYHDQWMNAAQDHYDALTTAQVAPAAAPEPTFLEELMSQNIQSYINPEKSFPAATALSLLDASSWRQEVLNEALMHALGLDVQHILASAIEADNTGQDRTTAIRRALNLKEK